MINFGMGENLKDLHHEGEIRPLTPLEWETFKKGFAVFRGEENGEVWYNQFSISDTDIELWECKEVRKYDALNAVNEKFILARCKDKQVRMNREGKYIFSVNSSMCRPFTDKDYYELGEWAIWFWCADTSPHK